MTYLGSNTRKLLNLPQYHLVIKSEHVWFVIHIQRVHTKLKTSFIIYIQHNSHVINSPVLCQHCS